MQQLAGTVQLRCQRSASARSGGVIINTCGWVDGEGYMLQLQSIEIFQPDFVFVIAHERLFSDLQAHFAPNTAIQIVKLPKSGGVCSETQALLVLTPCRWLLGIECIGKNLVSIKSKTISTAPRTN